MNLNRRGFFAATLGGWLTALYTPFISPTERIRLYALEQYRILEQYRKRKYPKETEAWKDFVRNGDPESVAAAMKSDTVIISKCVNGDTIIVWSGPCETTLPQGWAEDK